MKVKKSSKGLVMAIGLGVVLLGAVLLGISPSAALSQSPAACPLPAEGTLAYSELFDGPATMLTRRLLIAPGAVLGWHSHPGIGAYTILKRGTLTVEDGCGGEEVYTAGQAFIEAPNRVHRGKNLGTEEVETVQTFLVPLGTSISTSSPQRMCGAPASKAECKGEGWRDFTHPRSFSSQGDCTQYVLTGK